MTIEQTKEAIKVMQAYVDRKEVEYSAKGHDIWEPNAAPSWSWAGCDYRIKPTSTLRPWTADEVPLGAQMREKKVLHDRRILGWTSNQADRELWLDEREHSTDGGKTWSACGVVEEAK